VRFTSLAIKNLNFPFSSNYYLLLFLFLLLFFLNVVTATRDEICSLSVVYHRIVCGVVGVYVQQHRSSSAPALQWWWWRLIPGFYLFFKIFKSSIFIHILFLCVWVFYSVPSCLHKEIFYFFPFFLVPLAFSPLFLKLAYHQESRYIYLFIHIVISYAIYSIMLCILSLLYCNMWWIQVGWIFRWTIRHFIWRLELGELLPTDGGRRVHTHTHTYVI
jgi:hypothetical protein